MCILHKPGPELYVAAWMSHHNHAQNKDQEILDMNISIHTFNTTVKLPICMSIADIKASELQCLRYIIKGLLHTTDGVEPWLENYWLIRHELTMTKALQ